MSDPSTEALAQAREQPDAHEVGPAIDLLIAAGFVVVHRSKLGSERACRGEMRTIAARKELEAERATVIELRRQLADMENERSEYRSLYGKANIDCAEARAEIDDAVKFYTSLQAELATERRVLECAKAMLADMEEDRNTERQRLEESESDRRVQYCRADAAERLLATERQRAEAAEAAGRDQHDELQAVEERLAAVEKRADAAERERDSYWNDFEYAHKMWSILEDALAVSEAKRKALREALLDVGQIVIQMRIPTVEESAAGHDRALREKGEVHTIWTKALAADGKGTPPEETCMRGVRDDSEHYT